jgi:hypothetical protein
LRDVKASNNYPFLKLEIDGQHSIDSLDRLSYISPVKNRVPIIKIPIIVVYLTSGLLLVAGLYFLFCFSTNALTEFLRVNEPIQDAEVLIVEGWISGKFDEAVKEEFQKGSYKYILISGFADEDSEFGSTEITEGDTSRTASLASILIQMGIDSSKIKIVAISKSIKIHKTFAMAQAAGKWLQNNDPSIRRVNICTVWSHGRKTWCAFRKILSDTFSVGIITFPKETLPVDKWWTTRSGFRWQVWSFANYLYALLWPVSLLPD